MMLCGDTEENRDISIITFTLTEFERLNKFLTYSEFIFILYGRRIICKQFLKQ